MTYKKYLLILLVALIIAFVLFPLQDFIKGLGKEEIIKLLEEDFQFCEIIKNEGKNYWLVCNGRPFFATYEEGKVDYELNGWSFLQDGPLSNDLSDCEFYKSKRITGGFELIFYCDYSSIKPTAKILIFDLDKLETKIIGEVNFLPIFLEDLTSAYPNLENCEIDGVSGVSLQILDLNKIDVVCNGDRKSIYTYKKFDKYMFPLVDNNADSKTERSKYVFNQLFGDFCEIEENIENEYTIINLKSKCGSLPFDINVDYYFTSVVYGSEYHLIPKQTEVENYIIRNMLNKFILNTKEKEEIRFIKSYKNPQDDYQSNVKVYRFGDEVIKFFEREGEIFFIERVCDKLVCL